MQTLNVWVEGSPDPVGRMTADDNGTVQLAYAHAWIDAAANFPLSLSLPLREEPFGDAISRAFFSNLLQENDQLERVIAREGLDRGDIVGLLAHVGADCSGSVSVLREDHPPIKRPGSLSLDYDALSEDDFADLVLRLAQGRPLPAEMRDPSPVAGFRRKISLAALPGDRFGLPKAGSGAPTTHILKIPDPNHRQEARHEAFVTELAEQAGFNAGACVAGEVEGQEVLLITRFDRLVIEDEVYRVHQEDFAQALSLPAELKYERRGREGRRFDASAIARVLDATDRPALARERFLRLTLFNLLVGNNDNHAKNHALLHMPGQAPVLAPFYDLVPVGMVAGFTDQLAFRIGNANLPHEITAGDLESFCIALGIPAAGAGRILSSTATELIQAMERLSNDFPREMRPLDNLIGEISGLLNTELALGLAVRERDAHVVRGGGWNLS
jgi:serine/threonine-protein kinase HipA